MASRDAENWFEYHSERGRQLGIFWTQATMLLVVGNFVVATVL